MRCSRRDVFLCSCAVVAVARPARATADDEGERELVVVVEAPAHAGVDAPTIRRQVSEELGRPVLAPHDPRADTTADLLVVAIEGDRLRMSLRRGADHVLTRQVGLPSERTKRLQTAAWLAGNLARDQQLVGRRCHVYNVHQHGYAALALRKGRREVWRTDLRVLGRTRRGGRSRDPVRVRDRFWRDHDRREDAPAVIGRLRLRLVTPAAPSRAGGSTTQPPSSAGCAPGISARSRSRSIAGMGGLDCSRCGCLAMPRRRRTSSRRSFWRCRSRRAAFAATWTSKRSYWRSP